jgi:hypothetical protein
MSHNTKKHIGVENILYFYIFFKRRFSLEAWQEGHWGMFERPQKKSFDTTRAAQKDIVGAKNINFLVAEN